MVQFDGASTSEVILIWEGAPDAVEQFETAKKANKAIVLYDFAHELSPEQLSVLAEDVKPAVADSLGKGEGEIIFRDSKARVVEPRELFTSAEVFELLRSGRFPKDSPINFIQPKSGVGSFLAGHAVGLPTAIGAGILTEGVLQQVEKATGITLPAGTEADAMCIPFS